MAPAVVWGNAAAMTVPAKGGTGTREGFIHLQMEGEVKSFPKEGYFLLMELLKLPEFLLFKAKLLYCCSTMSQNITTLESQDVRCPLKQSGV